MARHLTGGELVDLAEGTRARDTAPHLDACESCRQQLAELSAAMSAAAELEVPDPWPLFWDQLAERVRAAVREDGAPGRGSWVDSWTRLVFPIAGGALAAVVIAMVLMRGATLRAPAGESVATSTATPEVELLSDDPSLGLVADLTAEMDWETAREAGLTADGSAEHAVTHLSDEELRQLQRLLQMELGRPGA